MASGSSFKEDLSSIPVSTVREGSWEPACPAGRRDAVEVSATEKEAMSWYAGERLEGQGGLSWGESRLRGSPSRRGLPAAPLPVVAVSTDGWVHHTPAGSLTLAEGSVRGPPC